MSIAGRRHRLLQGSGSVRVHASYASSVVSDNPVT